MTRRNHRGFALIELMTALAILGILTAVAIPVFRSLQARAHQAETAGNLSRIFASEVAFYAEEYRYGSFDEIGFSLTGVSNRYTYRSPAAGGAGGSTGTAGFDLINSQGGVTRPENTVVASGGTLYSPGVPAAFTATASGNIDNDPALDQWHVNDTRGGLVDPDLDDSTG